MVLQHDLFENPAGPDAACNAREEPETALAVPCGWHDRSNAPCRRLSRSRLLLDGEPLILDGRPLVLCDLACFNGEGEGSAITGLLISATDHGSRTSNNLVGRPDA